MVLTAWVEHEDDPEADERNLQAAIDQSLVAGRLGFNPWYTEHHFRGAWHSTPLQFAAYVAAQLPPERYVGFGVVTVPYHHPVRLVEQMNQLDQLTKGRTLYGLGSGFPGLEPASSGLDPDYHRSGQATRDSLEVMDQVWDYATGDKPYEFETELWSGRVVKRVVPSAYRRRRPTLIRTARDEDSTKEAAMLGLPIFFGAFDLAVQVPLYRQTLEQADHPIDVVNECLRWSTVDWNNLLITEREEDVEELVARAREERIEHRRRFLALRPESLAGTSLAEFGIGLTPEAFVGGIDMDRVKAGSVEQIREQVAELQGLGVNHMLLRFLGEFDGETRWIAEQTMRLFSERIAPQFAGA